MNELYTNIPDHLKVEYIKFVKDRSETECTKL